MNLARRGFAAAAFGNSNTFLRPFSDACRSVAENQQPNDCPSTPTACTDLASPAAPAPVLGTKELKFLLANMVPGSSVSDVPEEPFKAQLWQACEALWGPGGSDRASSPYDEAGFKLGIARTALCSTSGYVSLANIGMARKRLIADGRLPPKWGDTNLTKFMQSLDSSIEVHTVGTSTAVACINAARVLEKASKLATVLPRASHASDASVNTPAITRHEGEDEHMLVTFMNTEGAISTPPADAEKAALWRVCEAMWLPGGSDFSASGSEAAAFKLAIARTALSNASGHVYLASIGKARTMLLAAGTLSAWWKDTKLTSFLESCAHCLEVFKADPTGTAVRVKVASKAAGPPRTTVSADMRIRAGLEAASSSSSRPAATSRPLLFEIEMADDAGFTAGIEEQLLRFDAGHRRLLSPLLSTSNADLGAVGPATQAVESAEMGSSTTDGFASSMLAVLPSRVQEALQQFLDDQARSCTSSDMVREELIEIAIDEGRDIMLRFRSGKRCTIPNLQVPVAEAIATLQKVKLHDAQSDAAGFLTWKQLSSSAARLAGWRRDADPTLFTSDGRLGVPGTLHRISRGTVDRSGCIHGLTYRVGRHVPGIAQIFQDLLADICSSGAGGGIRSLLLVGPPGVGKTTLLRDVTRMLADTFGKAVAVVDTSNEIAGDYVVPHHCIGSARRFMVPDRRRQHEVLVEVVQNHTPEVIVVDEIGTTQEVRAIRDIAQRGVLMVGTAHGTDIHSLLNNHALSDLIGGVTSVTLGDDAANERNSGQKTRLERAGSPAFTTLIEVLADNKWRVHRNVAASVDTLLAAQSAGAMSMSSPGPCLGTETRRYDEHGRMLIAFERP